jgi:hypothetical protein
MMPSMLPPYCMTMNDNKIRKEISQRDSFGISDVFGVFINGFNDGQQDFQFLSTLLMDNQTA